jgi:hypothetical protein
MPKALAVLTTWERAKRSSVLDGVRVMPVEAQSDVRKREYTVSRTEQRLAVGGVSRETYSLQQKTGQQNKRKADQRRCCRVIGKTL